MRLTLAEGSLYYRVDADGNVYVPRHFARRRDGTIDRTRQTSGSETFWEPHGTVEELTEEQRRELEGEKPPPPDPKVAVLVARPASMWARLRARALGVGPDRPIEKRGGYQPRAPGPPPTMPPAPSGPKPVTRLHDPGGLPR